MRVEPIIQKLVKRVGSYFEDLGYDEEDIENDDLFHIVHEDNRKEQYSDIYLYAEISIEEFMRISDSLDDVVIKYDESAYFDVVEPGVYLARVYWSAGKQSDDNSVNIINSTILTKFGEYISFKLEDIYDEEFWIDNIEYDDKFQSLKIAVSSTNYSGKASVKVYEEDIDEYQDLVDIYSNKVLRELEKELDKI